MLLSRIYKPQTGFIEINQQDIQNYKIKEFAQKGCCCSPKKSKLMVIKDVKTNCRLWKITLPPLFTKIIPKKIMKS